MNMRLVIEGKVLRVVGYNYLVVFVSKYGVLIPLLDNIILPNSVSVDSLDSIAPTDERIQQRWFTTSEIHDEFGVALSTARKDMKEVSDTRKIRGQWRMPYVVAVELYQGGRQRGLK